MKYLCNDPLLSPSSLLLLSPAVHLHVQPSYVHIILPGVNPFDNPTPIIMC